MHETLQQWLDELSEEVEIDHSPAIGDQAIANMVTIGLSDSSLKDWGKDSLREFILGCRDLYKNKSEGQALLFYSWYDEQAGQLRFSAISSENKTPPFQCDLKFVELDIIVENIFAHSGGLLTEDEKLYIWMSKLGQ